RVRPARRRPRVRARPPRGPRPGRAGARRQHPGPGRPVARRLRPGGRPGRPAGPRGRRAGLARSRAAPGGGGRVAGDDPEPRRPGRTVARATL
ncbi:MAG: hypothetical protein AVDCRST_MAG16-1116, partial [uncultured Frankineae bacterium]